MQRHNCLYNITRPFQANDYTVKNNEFDSTVRSDRHEDSKKTYPARLFTFYR
jgi:hypothetical protein